MTNPEQFRVRETLEGFDRIVALVRAERVRQEKKWGIQTHTLDRWMLILGEEFGEVNKAILEGNLSEVKEELVQVAAVAMEIISGIPEECNVRCEPNGPADR